MNTEGIELVKRFEGYSLIAYKCPAGVWTIGYGNTTYLDGSKVKEGDKIDQATALLLLTETIKKFERQVCQVLKVKLNDNQLSALVSFTYNLGIANLKKSTLLKKVNINPNDKSIADEFKKWNKAGGKVLNGLTRRRTAEAELYFKI